MDFSGFEPELYVGLETVQMEGHCGQDVTIRVTPPLWPSQLLDGWRPENSYTVLLYKNRTAVIKVERQARLQRL